MESQGNHATNMAGEHIANNNIQQAGLGEPAFGAAVNPAAIQQAILPQAGVDVPQGRRLLKNNQNLVAFLQLNLVS